MAVEDIKNNKVGKGNMKYSSGTACSFSGQVHLSRHLKEFWSEPCKHLEKSLLGRDTGS